MRNNHQPEKSISGISLVIPTLGCENNITQLLQSIQDQKQIDEFEVLIVDNSLDLKIKDKLFNLCLKFGNNFRYVPCDTKGVNYARNLGLQQSQYSIVLFLDDDCYLQDQFLLKKHIQLHQKNPDYFAFGGVYILPQNSGFIQRHYHLLQMIWLQSGVYLEKSSGVEMTRFLIGGHFSFKKEIATSSHLQFDEKIIFGGSELSLFSKANKMGLKMSLQDLSVVHFSNVNALQLVKKLYKQGRGKAYLQEEEEPSFYNLNPDLSLTSKIFIALLNWFFWFGYYQYSKNYLGFFKRNMNTFKGIFLKVRGSLIERISKIEKEKNNRGDRF